MGFGELGVVRKLFGRERERGGRERVRERKRGRERDKGREDIIRA